MTTAVITQTFIPGPRLIDGTDLNKLVSQANAGFTGVYTTLQVGTLSATTLAVSGLSALSTTTIGGATTTTLAATGNSALATTQVSGLLSAQLGLAVTGNAALQTTQVAGLLTAQLGLTVSTGVATSLATTQIGSLTATTIAGAGSYVCNGTTPVTVTVGGLTASSVILFGLKTIGGTVGATPKAVFPPNTGNGTVTIAGTASDSSTYNVAALG